MQSFLTRHNQLSLSHTGKTIDLYIRSIIENSKAIMLLRRFVLVAALISTVFLAQLPPTCCAVSANTNHDDDETVSDGYLPPQNPPWPPSYNMHDSLITMQINSMGLSSPNRGAQFGIVSYDWSNMKYIWSTSQPMNCEELLVQQADATKLAATSLNTNTKVFVYRNIVKALPWLTTVRTKLDDPNYSGFFLKFDTTKVRQYHVSPCANEDPTHCSIYYHDQLQTPQVPSTEHPYPDGICTNAYCDCGLNPCGEYLFDHRNGTMLREWLIQEVVLGPTAIGHVNIDGLFLDDFWCSDLLCRDSNNAILGCPCNDPVQGPTEIDRYSQMDMGLSDQDIADLTIQWNITMGHVQRAILNHSAYTWSLIPGQNNANAYPSFLSSNPKQCMESCRQACRSDSIWQQYPMLFGLSITNSTILSQLEQDLSYFLLVRGPYAYAGWGVWGMTWPFQADPNNHGALPPTADDVPLPAAFDTDYGIPQELCYETGVNSGIFRRRWSKAVVELDCNIFHGKISFIDSTLITASV